MNSPSHLPIEDTLFAGPGEARRIARAVDWAATPLGPPGRWPEPLRTAVRICLASPAPGAVFAGPEHRLIHNEPYLAFLGGKERWAMGAPAREVWAEVWASLAPEFALVLSGGGAVQHVDAPYVLRRHGQDVESYFTFSLSPVGDDAGKILGIFNVAQETSSTVAALRRTERALRERERTSRRQLTELQTIYDSAHVGLCVLDTELRFVRINQRLAELNGVPAAAHLGRTVEEVVPSLAPTARDLVGRILRTGEAITDVEVKGTTPSRPGVERTFVEQWLPLKDGEGSVVGVNVVVEDVTERRRAEQELAASDRRKTEFLAVLSHELRNPLAPIRNSIFLLESAPADGPVSRRAREILHRQTDHLVRLVDDLLDLSRIAHGKIEVKPVRGDARELVRRAYLDAKGLFEARDVALLLSEPPEPLWVDADPARFSQMLGNLLHNALKFTPPRGRVEVEVARRGEACEVKVSDDGEGLDPADLERIFDAFQQATRPHRGTGGLGLGLALVRELAAKHGGEVRARSEGPGRGAQFVLSIPLAAAPEAPARADTAGAGGGAPLEILIVEDNEDAAATLADLLALGGHQVATALTGAEGVSAAAARHPDVLICDVGLPDMSGHEVIRAIRAAEQGRPVFAMALTGYAQPRDREAALAAGFDAHLPKPPPLDELTGLLRGAALSRKA